MVRPTQPVVPIAKRQTKNKIHENHIAGPTHHVKDKSHSPTSNESTPPEGNSAKKRIVRPALRVVPVAKEYRSRV